MTKSAAGVNKMEMPPFMDEICYLHHINKFDIKHVMNFLPGGGGYATPASLDEQKLIALGADLRRIETIKKQKEFYNLSKEELSLGLGDCISISRSPRIDILFNASQIRRGIKIGQCNLSKLTPVMQADGVYSVDMLTSWSNDDPNVEKKLLRISEMEIEFELGRRLYAPDSPSRLTCLFMVNDSLEGQILLSKMFGNNKSGRYKPLLLSLGILLKDKIAVADSNWFEKYAIAQDDKYIEAYWSGFVSEDPKWETLFEGMVGLRNKEQSLELKQILDNFTRVRIVT